MALDKVVDSAVLDAGLKQIADAIRGKGGTSDSLAFPSAMAEAIAAIQAGGGGGEGVFIATGSFMPGVSNPNHTVTHGLGVVPNFAVCYRIMNTTATSRGNSIIAVGKIDGLGTLVADNSGPVGGQDNTYSITDTPSEYAPFVGAYAATEQQITFGFNYDSSRGDTYYCFEQGWGEAFRWIVGVV